MAGTGKDGKDKKGGREEESAALRRLVEDFALLRAEVDVLRQPTSAPARPKSVRGGSQNSVFVATPTLDPLTATSDAAVSFAYTYRSGDGAEETESESEQLVRQGLGALLEPSDSGVARIGYAFSSPQKVGILRALMMNGAQSAAGIGRETNLTTGSLYHHLRELTHAGVIETNARNCYSLTRLGLGTTLLLFAQAGRPVDTD